jgi:hypothetical protein
MRLIVCLLISLVSCTHGRNQNPYVDLALMQSIWDSRDTGMAYKNLPGLREIEVDEGMAILGLNEIHMFSFAISVEKRSQKIVSMRLPFAETKGVLSSEVKSKLKSDDWRVYEHPKRGVDFIQLDVTEYSEVLGVGFAYDKLDKEKRTRMIYWGKEPKDIQTLL